jgi:hypothetical protein
MAIYRQIQTTFWSDTFITSLTPEQKYFYIYLLTNDKTKQCGIYEITLRQMCFDTGYDTNTVEKLLNMFAKSNKIKWSKATSEIAIMNWAKYNNHRSPKVKVCIEKELKLVKNTVLIPYLYPIDTILQQEQEEEQTQEETETQEETPEIPKADTSAVTIDFEKLKNVYNAGAEKNGMPQIKEMTKERKTRTTSLVKEFGKEKFMMAMENMFASVFCKGENKTGWVASFDFLIQKSSFVKLIENTYDRSLGKPKVIMTKQTRTL